jgi:hypothetical protein
MRKSPAPSTVVPFTPGVSRSYDRRPLPKVFVEFTCIVLVKHHETAKAVLVSTAGDAVGAVWVPKAMLGLDKTDRGRFLVATVSKAFAGQKRLDVGHLKLEWTDQLTPEERTQLKSAEELARRTRQRFNGYRPSTLSHFGRNEFA